MNENKEIKIAIAGYGNVGKATLKTIITNNKNIERRSGFKLTVKTVFSRNIKEKHDEYLDTVENKTEDLNDILNDNNIDFDKALANGEVTCVCTRRGDLGRVSHKAFGLFFLLSMQNAVLRRPGNENSRIPHFLYIDEFPDFICKDTEAIFTLYRKYKVATVITAQNLAQLEANAPEMKYKETILSNCASKMFVGGGTPTELEWWEKEFMLRREWKYGNNMDMNKLEYDSKYSGVKYDWSNYFKANKLANLAFKHVAVKLKTEKGNFQIGEGTFNFIASKYKEEQPIKVYNFSKFVPGVASEGEDDVKQKFDPKHISFVDEKDEYNPVQIDNTDADFEFDNENAIVVNFKKKKK